MISIVIPVYNVENYLTQCLESVFKLRSDIEIVLVDDGSTDSSGKLCDDYAKGNNRVKVIHQKNAGLSVARNTGILNSSGDYVMFLDSDDFINPIETDIMLSNLVVEPEVLVGLYNNYFTKSNKYVSEDIGEFAKLEGLCCIDNFLETVQNNANRFYMIACRFVVRRSLLINNSLLFTPEIYHEDEEWTMRLACYINNVFVSHNRFYNYRRARDGAITSEVKTKHILDSFKIIDKAFILLASNGITTKKRNYINSRINNLYINAMIHLYQFDDDGRKLVYDLLNLYYRAIFNNLSGTIGCLVKLFNSIFGLKRTCLLLHIAKKFKNLIKR